MEIEKNYRERRVQLNKLSLQSQSTWIREMGQSDRSQLTGGGLLIGQLGPWGQLGYLLSPHLESSSNRLGP